MVSLELSGQIAESPGGYKRARPDAGLHQNAKQIGPELIRRNAGEPPKTRHSLAPLKHGAAIRISESNRDEPKLTKDLRSGP